MFGPYLVLAAIGLLVLATLSAGFPGFILGLIAVMLAAD